MKQTMKAVALTRYLPITDPESLQDFDLPKPAADKRDLLVRVEAVSVNPVDVKVRAPKPSGSISYRCPNQGLLANTGVGSGQFLDAIGRGVVIVAGLEREADSENVAPNAKDREGCDLMAKTYFQPADEPISDRSIWFQSELDSKTGGGTSRNFAALHRLFSKEQF
jgi:hypothetical protein